MERTNGSSVLGADGALLTPPLSSDTSLQDMIEAELRTRRATELPPKEPEQEQEPMVVAADLKPSRFVTEQPESMMVLEPAGRAGSDDDSDSEVTRVTRVTEVTEVTEVTPDTETAEPAETREVTTRVTEDTEEVPSEKITDQVVEQVTEDVTEHPTQQVTEQVTEHVTEHVTEQVSEQVTEQVTNQVTEEMSEHLTEKLTEQLPQHKSEETEELPETCIDEDQPSVVTADTASVHSSHSSHSRQSRQSSHSSRRSSAASDHGDQLLQPQQEDQLLQVQQEDQLLQVQQEEASPQEEQEVTGAGEGLSAPPSEQPAELAAEESAKVSPEVAAVEAVEVAAVSASVEAEVMPGSVADSAEARSPSPAGRSGQLSRESTPPAEQAPASACDDAETVQPTLAVTEDAAASDVTLTAGDVTAPVFDDVTAPVSADVTGPVSDDGIGGIESSKVTDEDSDEGVGGGSDRRGDAKDAKKLRRKKKTDAENEAGRRRSSFGKEESADHTRIHVRSFDSSKAIRRFSKDGPESASSSECRCCGRRVFQMESVHAESAVWHKNCFRCSQCNKHLTVDTYASHEGKLYCVVHHRQLLKAPAPAAAPAAEDATDSGTRADSREMVGAEEQDGSPLPHTEVVRASNKADYGLDDLQHLNVKDRFSVFERTNEDEHEKTPSSVEVKRSQSILDKMKKFQGRTAARDPDSPDDSEGSGDEGHGPRDPDTVRSSTKKERPMSFAGLGDAKSRFEGGGGAPREAAQDPAKGELAKLRGMICGAREHKLAYEEALREQETLSETRRTAEDPSLVVQGNLRETYQRAVQEAESPRPSSREEAVVRGVRAADMASKFERGQLDTENGHGATQNGASPSEELTGPGENSLTSDVDSGELARVDSPDSGPAAPEQSAAPAPAPAADPELVNSDTTKRMLNKFKQLEQSAAQPDDELSPSRERPQGNARQMLSKYRQMQEAAQKEDLPDGPRPLKSFTPPPEDPVASEEQEDAEDAEDPDIVRASSKVADEFLNKKTDQARSLRDKFESWTPPAERGFTVEDDCKPSLEITRNLAAKFESLKEQQKVADKPQTQHRTSKFIMEPSQAAEMCGACSKRVYAMERLEVDKRIMHKNCFRCSKCNCVLRMDTYTFNAGKLFCTPHFKQIFKTKGNYDEGFGVESCAKHWSSSANTANTASHADQPAAQNGTTSAAPRPAGETAETNGSSASPDTNGASSPEPEQTEQREPEQVEEHREPEPTSDDERAAVSDPEPDPEPQPEPQPGADVFQQVYESTVSPGGL